MQWPDTRTWGSTAAERQAVFACDRYLAGCDDVVFRAVSVAAPAPRLFRWLCQLRVAPYSYDWIDNFGRRSPRRLIAGLDELRVGQSVMSIFELVDFEPGRQLTLRSRPSRVFGQYVATYAVMPTDERSCRLVVKLLTVYPRIAPMSWAVRQFGPLGDLIMMRKQLLTLKQLAEGDGSSPT